MYMGRGGFWAGRGSGRAVLRGWRPGAWCPRRRRGRRSRPGKGSWFPRPGRLPGLRPGRGVAATAAVACGGAQAAGRTGDAVGGGEGGHDRVPAVLSDRYPGRRCLALRAGDDPGVVIDGEVGAGVALPGAGLRGGVGQQRPDQRDAVPGVLGDHQGCAEVPRVKVMPSRCQVLARELVIDGAGHLVVGHRGIGGGHVGDQVREYQVRAVLVMPAVLRARPGGASVRPCRRAPGRRRAGRRCRSRTRAACSPARTPRA